MLLGIFLPYLLKIGPTRLRLGILSAGLPGFAVMSVPRAA
jgi:hypothetical protein